MGVKFRKIFFKKYVVSGKVRSNLRVIEKIVKLDTLMIIQNVTSFNFQIRKYNRIVCLVVIINCKKQHWFSGRQKTFKVYIKKAYD